MLKKLAHFFSDCWHFKRDPRHIIRPSSYHIMRRLDIYTLGFSTHLLKHYLTPRRYRANDAVSNALADSGFAKLGNFSGPHLDALTQLPVFCRAKPQLRGAIDEVAPAAYDVLGRLDIYTADILRSQALAEFITKGPFLDMAKNHYGRDVTCVSVNGWWSIPTSNKDGAAQKFHRDIDWLGELKFFIFAVDVTPLNGPFDFILKSHRKRLDRFMLSDGRIEEPHMFKAYDKTTDLASTICSKGDAYAVDTRGYHQGRPLIEGRRCVVSIEFSTASFGAEFQYSPRPALETAWESYDTWHSAIAANPAWAGLFS